MRLFGRAGLLLLLFILSNFTVSLTSAEEAGDWRAIRMKVNDVTGEYNWSINWDISFTYTKFDTVLPDGNGIFINRQIDRRSYLPPKPLVNRDWPGIDEIPIGANVSMAAMPPSKRLPGSGGELFQINDGKTAHQRDWDALVAKRDEIFKLNGITEDAPLMKKVKSIADWAMAVNRKGPLYESKHPVDLIFHSSFCVGRANAFVAIMHTMGLPARTVNMNGHSVAEVQIDGKWYFAENSYAGSDKTASFLPCSLMEFYSNPFAYKENTSDAHIASPYYAKEDLHNGRANWQLGALWRWHFIQCGKGDDMLMRDTMKNGSGIAATLNGSTSHALYPKAKTHYYKVIKGNPPVMTNYHKHSWYRAGHRVLQGDRIRKRFYVGNLDDPANPVTKITSRLYLMGGETQTFTTDLFFSKENADWTLMVNKKLYKLKDFKGWKLVKGFDALTMLPEIYFEFELDKKDFKQNNYNVLELGSKPGRKYYEQHLYVMIFPDPVEPYIAPYKPLKGSRAQKKWRIITDQKWDLLQICEYAH